MAPIPRKEYCGRIRQEIKTGAFWRDAFAEFVSVFFFVAAYIFMVQTSGWQSPNPLQIGTGVAFVWAAIGYGLGDFGGAHISPAVTMAMLIRAEVTFFKALLYWIMQAVGSIGGAFFFYAVTPEAVRGTLGNFTLNPTYAWWQGMLIEAVITCILCLSALGSLSLNRKGYVILQSLPTGMAAGLGSLVALGSTGACMNPTLAMGPAVVQSIMKDNNPYWDNHWVYWAGPMIGALLAAIFYWIFDSADKEEVSHMVYGTWSYAQHGAGRPGKSTSREALTPASDAGLYPAF